MVYGDFNDLNRRTSADKLLRDKSFNIAKDPKYIRYQRGLVSVVYKFFDEKTSGSGIRYEKIYNKELTGELHKPIVRTSNKGKLHSPFIYNIWGAYLADMQLISTFNKGFRFSLCLIDIYRKSSWVIPLKIKKKLQLLMLFKKS